ncbi:putative extracellular sulfatase Sulf-1-like protein [Leptotrombidium deliense]|uniref:Putative extracellular sulfatase Sulf-1-like protein n=1 Tax=Leptotrombidium deliense TaxID=299467 RepID=A0A443SMB7_9ACAR|nr:putative extracellular sulfatase Sulf-1-like protein [Leptotrombidium deliense]
MYNTGCIIQYFSLTLRLVSIFGIETASWDYAPNPDKQWLLRHTRQMEQIHVHFTDLLHTKRLQTLQSIDEAVEKIYNELRALEQLNDTYILYTSDHGYHLGQFGLVKGKSMPFEFDVRVPFYIRGPNIKPGISVQNIVLNIDIAPTLLDIAGVSIPDRMDGQSFLSALRDLKNIGNENTKNDLIKANNSKPARDSFLIERGKALVYHSDSSSNSTIKKMSKKQWLAVECQKPEFKHPCAHYQLWECVLNNGEYKMKKCRIKYNVAGVNNNQTNGGDCVCGDSLDDTNQRVFQSAHFIENYDLSEQRSQQYLDLLEKRLQRRFLKEHVKRHFRPVFIGSRSKRAIDKQSSVADTREFDVLGVYALSKYLDASDNKESDNSVSNDTTNFANISDSTKDESDDTSKSTFDRQRVNSLCDVHLNRSVWCAKQVYHNKDSWKRKKERVDNLIKKLQLKLELLKGIRRHLNWRKPLQNDAGNGCVCDSRKQPESDADQTHVSIQSKYSEYTNSRKHSSKDRKSRRKVKKLRRKIKFENTTCNYEKMNCFTHDNDHWKTAPLWTGQLRFCCCSRMFSCFIVT